MKTPNLVQLTKDLMEFGYLPAPEVRSFGGSFALRCPKTRRVIFEEDFEHELSEVLHNNR